MDTTMELAGGEETEFAWVDSKVHGILRVALRGTLMCMSLLLVATYLLLCWFFRIENSSHVNVHHYSMMFDPAQF